MPRWADATSVEHALDGIGWELLAKDDRFMVFSHPQRYGAYLQVRHENGKVRLDDVAKQLEYEFVDVDAFFAELGAMG